MNDITFWTASFFTLAGLVAGAISTFNSTDHKSRWIIIFITVGSGFALFTTSYSSHMDAKMWADTAEARHNRDLTLAIGTSKKASYIIDSLNYTLQTTQKILIKSNDVFAKQTEIAGGLNHQIENAKILKHTIESTSLATLNRIDTTISTVDKLLTGGSAILTTQIAKVRDGVLCFGLKNNFNFPIPQLSLQIADYDALLSCNHLFPDGKNRVSFVCYGTFSKSYTQTFGAKQAANFPEITDFVKTDNEIHRATISVIGLKKSYLIQILYKLNKKGEGPIYTKTSYLQDYKLGAEITSNIPHDLKNEWAAFFPVVDFIPYN